MGFWSVARQSEYSFTIEKSVFIGNCKQVYTADEAKDFIAEISAKYRDATHNCYAYVLRSDSSEQKMSDDHEPQGTAGLPILDVIKKKGLTNVVVVVTRYFGGIKLGAGGLVGAYTRSAAEVLDVAESKRYEYCDVMDVCGDYTYYSRLSDAVNKYGITLGVSYDSGITVRCAVPQISTEDLIRDVASITAGKGTVTVTGKDYFALK